LFFSVTASTYVGKNRTFLMLVVLRERFWKTRRLTYFHSTYFLKCTSNAQQHRLLHRPKDGARIWTLTREWNVIQYICMKMKQYYLHWWSGCEVSCPGTKLFCWNWWSGYEISYPEITLHIRALCKLLTRVQNLAWETDLSPVAHSQLMWVNKSPQIFLLTWSTRQSRRGSR
jgi:hypothetical protein